MANVSGHGRINIAEQLAGNAQRSFFRTDLQESLCILLDHGASSPFRKLQSSGNLGH